MDALLLLSLGLRAVFVQQLEGLGSGVAVEGVLELGDRGRDFQAHVQDLLLALEADVLGPSNFSRQISYFFPRSVRKQAYLTMRERLRLGWISCPIPKFRDRFSRRGFCHKRSALSPPAPRLLRFELLHMRRGNEVGRRTFAAFLLAPAFPCGNGAAAGFFPLGGCH